MSFTEWRMDMECVSVFSVVSVVFVFMNFWGIVNNLLIKNVYLKALLTVFCGPLRASVYVC